MGRVIPRGTPIIATHSKKIVDSGTCLAFGWSRSPSCILKPSESAVSVGWSHLSQVVVRPSFNHTIGSLSVSTWRSAATGSSSLDISIPLALFLLGPQPNATLHPLGQDHR